MACENIPPPVTSYKSRATAGAFPGTTKINFCTLVRNVLSIRSRLIYGSGTVADGSSLRAHHQVAAFSPTASLIINTAKRIIIFSRAHAINARNVFPHSPARRNRELVMWSMFTRREQWVMMIECTGGWARRSDPQQVEMKKFSWSNSTLNLFLLSSDGFVADFFRTPIAIAIEWHHEG